MGVGLANQSERIFGDIVDIASEPNEHALCVGVHFTHSFDLMSLFLVIFLVDTQGIRPK
ncbi:hypothetical protein AA0117_g8804 [Alternaria alternata]|jgi:hypothetical protein|uniref:Uncharacterized protein n=1 Tax=Alternaria alternata TaxID=5599 RepID=A0A4Q4N8J8_ALTAL|nr:hypothetical protein AA0118_g2592 [Alternaria tenuissima]RYN72208.1 hypothetical protein AA0117_g8804 [Alternaria alternata]